MLFENIKQHNALHQFPRNKSATSWQLPHLRGSYGETCVMDFGHNSPSARGVIRSPYALQFLIHCAFVLVLFVGEQQVKISAHFPLVTLEATLNNVHRRTVRANFF